MQITGNSGLLGMAQANKAKVSGNKQQNYVPQEAAQFDQITFSMQGKLEGGDKVQQEACTRISNEVRTHNTTSKIAQLREEVQQGTYVADARETASRMLLMGAVE